MYLKLANILCFLCSVPVLAENDWSTEKNDVSAVILSEFNDNLYFQKQNKPSVLDTKVEANYHFVGLYEGYGISLPLELSQNIVHGESQLNHLDFQFTPALNVFITESSNVTLAAKTNSIRKINGERGAEFLPSTVPFADDESRQGQVKISLGRAPNKQFVMVSGQYSKQQQQFREITVTDTESKSVSTRYGLKVSEDSYALIDGAYKDEQRSGIDSDLVEIGFGFYTRLGGTHQLNLIVGYFERDGASKSDGHYWLLSDRWALTEDVMLSIKSEQRSEISLSERSLTQLTTENQLAYGYQINTEHAIGLTLSQIDQEFEQSDGFHKRLVAEADWQWLLSEGFKMDTSLSLERIDKNDMREKITQRKANVSLEYKW